MKTFTGLQYLKIDIANSYGLDKESWDDRINNINELIQGCYYDGNLSNFTNQAEEPLLYMKAVKAYNDTIAGISTGHNMFLDATASGLQILAVLSGCKKTAERVNLINTGMREDVYESTAQAMNRLLTASEQVTRDSIKKPHMTFWYNKNGHETFTENQQLAFYEVIETGFEGAKAVKDTINDHWDSNALEHKWSLPDGQVAKVLVTEMVDARIEVDELDHSTFVYRFEANKPSGRYLSLLPNIN